MLLRKTCNLRSALHSQLSQPMILNFFLDSKTHILHYKVNATTDDLKFFLDSKTHIFQYKAKVTADDLKFLPRLKNLYLTLQCQSHKPMI